jgi:hypothetical protein
MDRAPVSKPARCEFDSRQGLPSVFACLRRAVRKIAVRLWAGQAFSCARRSDRVAGELGDEEAAHAHGAISEGRARCAPYCRLYRQEAAKTATNPIPATARFAGSADIPMRLD